MKNRNLGILIYNDVEVLDFAGPFEVFNAANEVHGENIFNVFTIAETSEAISARNGLKVIPDCSINTCPALDILLVPGGNGRKFQMNNPVITGWIKKVFDDLELLLTVCTGVFIAGKAGVLNVKEATTHHGSYEEFGKNFPNINLVKYVKYVDSGKIVTSGGISAGINMSLFVIDKLIGENLGKKIAEHMEYDYNTGASAALGKT
ncbi:MAG TPA: DJ-1/PfpI family protein [Ignavibacteria bacterium]|jgi:transcriptional regulator GlxA family with amidase domain